MSADLFSPSFDFGHVDGIGRAQQRDIAPRLDGMTFRATAIGPIVEYTHLIKADGVGKLRAQRWFDDGSLSALLDALECHRTNWLSQDGRCGLLRGDALSAENDLNSLKIDAHKSALGAGFGKIAPLLVAAMGELIGNITDHSQLEESGIAIFLARPSRFEFVVADQGIGALQSLRQCAVYDALSDEGEALASMIETGVSRFGPNAGHGHGFRPIFERLADATGHLRFRSGDYALSLDGRFGDRISRQMSQKPDLSGFLASVECRL